MSIIRRTRKPMKRRLTRKPLVRRRPLGRRYVSKQRVNDSAGVSETIDLYSEIAGGTSVNNYVTINRSSLGTAYTTSDIQLSDFLRASNVAQSYQFYRLKYVEIKFLPDVDTFNIGAASGKPYLYYQIDKGQAISNTVTNVDLKTSGCKPIALDEKPITIRFKPAVLLSTLLDTDTGLSEPNMYKVSPMLKTNANTSGPFSPSPVAHQGMKFFVENNGAPLNYSAQITAHFQFMKPRFDSPPRPAPPAE